jgi:cytochrome c oxidase subunit IV
MSDRENRPSANEPLVTRSLLLTWLALLALAATTVGSAYLRLGWGNGAVNLAIAAGKALLVMLVFMRLARSDGIVRTFAFGVFFWIVAMLALALLDFATQPG